jgi:hypothetical protein
MHYTEYGVNSLHRIYDCRDGSGSVVKSPSTFRLQQKMERSREQGRMKKKQPLPVRSDMRLVPIMQGYQHARLIEAPVFM